MAFAKGDALEVAGDAGSGFADCYFAGRVTRVFQPVGARNAVVPVLGIEYPDFLDASGKTEYDEHPARSHRLRPPLPASMVPKTLEEYQVRRGRQGEPQVLNGGCRHRCRQPPAQPP